MKRILFIVTAVFLGITSFAQEKDSTALENGGKEIVIDSRAKERGLVLRRRAADHFMLQLGVTNWASKPDTVNTGGLSRSFNVQFLFDFQFKSSPQYSVALGAGIGTDNIFFKQTNINLRRYPLDFSKDEANTFKKFKLGTTYLEVPLELRFTANPNNFNKSFKAALGVKVGTMVSGYSKAVVTRDANGLGNYTERIHDRRNFNSLRLAGTARVGYGVFSVFGTYQFNSLIREGAGPQVSPYTIGLAVSGL